MPPSSEIQFSSAELLDRDFADHKPRLSFDGDTVDAWRDWRTQLLPELREQLGPFPGRSVSSKPANRFHRSLRQVHNPQSDLPLTSGGCNSRLSVDPERRNGKDARRPLHPRTCAGRQRERHLRQWRVRVPLWS